VKNQSITSLPRSPYDDRRARMIKYSLAMGIRMICILSLLFVQGWWLVIMATGAIVLPYIAVVLANVGAKPGAGVEAPGGREVMLRNPQTPVVVPPAEDQPAEPRFDGAAAQSFGPDGEPRPAQPFDQSPFDQNASEQGPFAQGGYAQGPYTQRPYPHGPFAQPAGPSSASPVDPTDERPAGPPADSADRPGPAAEGQA
jgi:hypothetical protein